MDISCVDQIFESGDIREWILESGTTVAASKEDILRDILELDKAYSQSHSYPNSEEISSIAWLPEYNFQFPLEACQDSNMVDIFSSSSQTLANTEDALMVVSVPMYDINISLKAYQDAPKGNEYECKIDTADKGSRVFAQTLKGQDKTSVKRKNAKREPSYCPQERVKIKKERNKEAARAYRKRRRIEGQELVAKLEFLKKKKAMLKEELRKAKDLFDLFN